MNFNEWTLRHADPLEVSTCFKCGAVLHEDDLIGVRLSKDPTDWEYACIICKAKLDLPAADDEEALDERGWLE